MEREYSSAVLENAVTALSRLPGIGRKTALRLALHLLRRPEDEADAIGKAIVELRHSIRYCSVCHNICESEVCDICSSPARSAATVCVVETVRDVMSIEATGQYRGLYHVLGGVISPIDGIGPDQLEMASLARRIESDEAVEEVILATSPTVEGDTTNYYIYRMLSRLPRKVRLTQLARGVAVGNDIEYTDEATLARSIVNRTPFEI
ncbi:MAG: recombination mediator RecR [Muribaculaceae bacterium]|nr:recombination mediator RecR [Muribaculaceae bacterium]